MSAPFWAVDLADGFWEAAGMVEPFPRDLRRPVARALPLTVVSLPRLWTTNVRDWLLRRDIVCPRVERERPLRACLIARSGSGVAFIDGTDPEDEQRFSLAHELAHFLRHYWQPRLKASRRLGEQVIEVFDGLRPPTRGEELRSLLAGVPVGFHTHLMDRDADGAVSTAGIAAAEAEADRLALELLAPADVVLASTSGAPRPELERRLREEYGLPAPQARDYARMLMPPPADDPLLKRLGIGG